MCSAELFDFLDVQARVSRRGKKMLDGRKCESLPFGGVQIIIIGDFYQLPPINGKMAFHARAFSECKFVNVELHVGLRQVNREHFQFLNRIRNGHLLTSDEVFLKMKSNAWKMSTCDSREKITTHIYGTNAEVEEENKNYLRKLEGEMVEIPMKLRCRNKLFEKNKKLVKKKIRVRFDENFKKNAVVQFALNIDVDKGLCNGRQCIIQKFTKQGLPVVSFFSDPKRYIVKYHRHVVTSSSTKYSSTKRKHGKEDNEVYFIPLRIAHAMTVHRSQGLTLEKVHVDLSKIFQPGQTYVALSRCRNMDDLTISNYKSQCIKINSDVENFYMNLALSTE
jgi:ATP-dependent DNA helicase PIF1